MAAPRNTTLLLAGAASMGAALLHLACIAGGPAWYRALGAGEGIATMAVRGHWYPATVTVVIAALLSAWALYAWSGAGAIGRLPLLRTALCAITAVYLLRGVAGAALQPWFPGNSAAFWFWSSAICLGIGLLHAVGLWRAWPRLSVAVA